MKHYEYELQKNVCKYLNLQYPNVLYYSDTIANVKLNITQGVRNTMIQKKGFKMPDLIILHPNDNYHALCIELKVNNPYKKNGKLKSDIHLIGQQKSINELNNIGYYACFCVGFDEAKSIIDWYFKK